MSQTNILLESGTNELEIVEFYVNCDGYVGHYGLNVAKVVEIIRRQPVTTLPELRHPAVLGAFCHRNDKVIPLVDTARYLGSAPIENEDAKVIVTEFNTVRTAFLVSGVNRIYRLSWTDVEAPGSLLQHASKSSVTGVVRIDNRVVFLLDLEAMVGELHPAMAIRFDQPEENTPEEEDSIYHVLHVDDSSSIRGMVNHMLKKEGRFTLDQCTNGQEAWEWLLALKQRCANDGSAVTDHVQAVVSDIEMPTMDGLTLCRKIKDDPVLRELPVALFSSLINEALTRKCVAVGADAQFSKPDLRKLSEAVYDIIKQRRAHA